MEDFIRFSIIFPLPAFVKPIDSHLGKRSYDHKALTYGDVFAFLFGNYLCGGVENRDANTNVKFHQKDTLERIITRIEKQSKVVIHNFRADCGSFSSSILEYVKDHCEHFSSKAKETLAHKIKKAEKT